jgi:PPOX class probable F420-dependent enzyme
MQKREQYMVSEPMPTPKRGFVPWSWADRQLRAMRSIWVSTTRPDSRPHAVPVWFTWDGRTLYFSTGGRAQKARNIRHEPWVVIHAGDGDDVIILEGLAEVVTDDAELHTVDAARAEKYVSPRTGARDTILTPATVVYRVVVQRVMAWEYGNMASRTDWLFDHAPEGVGDARR